MPPHRLRAVNGINGITCIESYMPGMATLVALFSAGSPRISRTDLSTFRFSIAFIPGRLDQGSGFFVD